jgi:hypothetical protein
MRPRDIISFFNFIIQRADREKVFTAKMIKDAETEYSESRYNALSDEWFSDYPNFVEATKLLRHRKPKFIITEIKQEDIDNFALDLQMEELKQNYNLGKIFKLTRDYINQKIDHNELREHLTRIFFELGIIGISTGSGEKAIFSFDEHRDVRNPIVNRQTVIHVHKAFWCALEIDLKPNNET